MAAEQPRHEHWYSGAWWAQFRPRSGLPRVHWHPCGGDALAIRQALDAGAEAYHDPTACSWALVGRGHACDPADRHWQQDLGPRVPQAAPAAHLHAPTATPGLPPAPRQPLFP